MNWRFRTRRARPLFLRKLDHALPKEAAAARLARKKELGDAGVPEPLAGRIETACAIERYIRLLGLPVRAPTGASTVSGGHGWRRRSKSIAVELLDGAWTMRRPQGDPPRAGGAEPGVRERPHRIS